MKLGTEQLIDKCLRGNAAKDIIGLIEEELADIRSVRLFLLKDIKASKLNINPSKVAIKENKIEITVDRELLKERKADINNIIDSYEAVYSGIDFDVIESYGLVTYLIREIPARTTYGEDAAYEVSKFEGTKAPTAVYRVTRRGSRWFCDCPGFARQRKGEPHKHIEMVKAWLAKGKPDPITTPGFQDWIQSFL